MLKLNWKHVYMIILHVYVNHIPYPILNKLEESVDVEEECQQQTSVCSVPINQTDYFLDALLLCHQV